MSEDFDMIERLAELESRELDRQNAARAAALGEALERAGAIYPQAHQIVDGELSFDDEGNPTNADELVAKTREAHPALFGRRAAPGDMNARIRAGAGRGVGRTQPRSADGTFTSKGPGRVSAGTHEDPPKTVNQFINEAIRRAAGR